MAKGVGNHGHGLYRRLRKAVTMYVVAGGQTESPLPRTDAEGAMEKRDTAKKVEAKSCLNVSDW